MLSKVIQDFHIEFGRPDATYAPGDVVTGKVHLKLSSSKNVREIRLEARGEAEVHWTKYQNVTDASGRSRSKTEHYKANEQYFNFSYCLVGNANGNTQTIPSGENVYEFNFQLPTNTPCSIEHSLGYVRYMLKAILDRPWRFDQKVVAAFTVVKPHDLNQIPLTGINDQICRPFKYFCIINFGEIKLNVKSRVSGFVPGETIVLSVSYDNSSSRVELTKIKINLEQILTFFARSPIVEKKVKSIIIAKSKSEGPFGSEGEATILLDVPALPPSNLESCSIIDLKYRLNFTAHLSGLYSNITRSYPIEIGTIPLRDRSENYRAPDYVVNATPSAPTIDNLGPAPPYPTFNPSNIGFTFNMNTPPYPTNSENMPNPYIAPPSYEQCVFGSNQIADPNGQGVYGPNTPFAPRYPVYKFPMPYST